MKAFIVRVYMKPSTHFFQNTTFSVPSRRALTCFCPLDSDAKSKLTQIIVVPTHITTVIQHTNGNICFITMLSSAMNEDLLIELVQGYSHSIIKRINSGMALL
jgi:hypothetical protein